MRLLLLLFVAVVLVTEALAGRARSASLQRRADDSFYQAPSGWESSAPGTILRSRKVDIAEWGLFHLGVTGYQLLYRTNGIDKNTPMATVTTVLVPDNYAHDKLVVSSTYEDSYSTTCAPSRRLLPSFDLFTNVAISYQEMFLTTLLNEGWVVTVPDHEGPQAAFTSGRLEGHAVLDAIRATLQYDRISLDSDAKVVGYGYSGGALAAGWAAGLQRQYASELNVVGWSLGGTVSNLTGWLPFMDGTTGAGFVLASIGGLTATYPQLSWVRDLATQQGEAALARSSELCMYQNLAASLNKHYFSSDYFQYGSTYLNNLHWRDVLQSLEMGRSSKFVPMAPVFMFHAQNDNVVPYSLARGTAEAWCQQGAQIKFLTLTGLEMSHTNTELLNLPNVLFFMRQRFQGGDWGERCQRPSISSPILSPTSLGQSLVQVAQQLIALLGTRIGPKDMILNAKVQNHEEP